MENNAGGEPDNAQGRAITLLNRLLVAVDDLILIAVSLGIICVAVFLLYESFTDLIRHTRLSVPHVVSDLMYVLIIMELFRQVFRQINRQPFSLDPFIYIGVIASIRGVLLTQMRLGMGEEDWLKGVIQIGVYAAIVFVLIIALYFYSRRGAGSA